MNFIAWMLRAQNFLLLCRSSGRQKQRDWYVNYITPHPYSANVLKGFIDHIFSQMKNEDLIEENVLDVGCF